MTEWDTPSGPPCGKLFSLVAQWRTTTNALGVPTPTGGGARRESRGPRAPEGKDGLRTGSAPAAHRPTPAVPTQTLRSVPPAGFRLRGALRVGMGRAPRVAPVPHRKQKKAENERQGDGPERAPLPALGRGHWLGETRVRPVALLLSPRRPQRSTAAQSSSWLLWVSCPKSGSSSSMWGSS